MQPGAMLYTQGFGSRPENVEVPHIDVRAPTAQDTNAGFFPIGKRWIDKVAGNEYSLTSFSVSNGITTANWAFLGSSSGDLNTLSGDTGTATPSSGNIKISGTANEITTAASGSTVTLTIPSAFTAPGSITSTTTITAGTSISAGTSITAGTTLTATSGNITATNGNLVLADAGNKLSIHATTTASDSVGITGVMSGTPGAVSVSTTACTTSSIILYSRNVTGGTPGEVSITAQTTGSFTLTSTGNETSTFNYLIIN